MNKSSKQIGALSSLQPSEDDHVLLQCTWMEMLSRYTSDSESIQITYAMLAKMYSATHRYYHNLHHIAEIIRLIDSFNESISNRDSMYLATWFHDAVYNTKSSDNEEKSAALALKEMSKLGIPPDARGIVEEMILRTKTHDTTSGFITSDASLFLDADLSILGAEPDAYNQYSTAIRKEYSWVPNILYHSGRRKVLESFLHRRRIYLTPELHSRLEDRAKANITRELESL